MDASCGMTRVKLIPLHNLDIGQLRSVLLMIITLKNFKFRNILLSIRSRICFKKLYEGADVVWLYIVFGKSSMLCAIL